MQLIIEKRGYRLLPLLALAVALAFLALISRDSAAVHDANLFELDVEVPGASPPCPAGVTPCSNANTIDNSGAGAPYDWETVCKATNLTTNRTITDIDPAPTGVGQSVCIADWALPDSTTFATGSKDIGDIAPGGFAGSGTWACAKDNNVLEKNEIMNSYSVLMTNPADAHQHLYFGLERPSNNGTSFMGFWFLLNEVDCVGPEHGSANWTGGLHEPGDLLILSDFSGGGRVSTVRILQWNPNNILDLPQCEPGAPPTGSGNLIPDVNVGPLCEVAQPGQDCSIAAANDTVCGGVNAQTLTTPWWNQPKQPPCAPSKGGVQAAPGTTAPCTVPLKSNTLFEGGIDLTDILCPGADPCTLPCFSTFIAETRSSDSETADLKDFARGAFDICGKARIIKQTDPDGAEGTFTYDSTLPCDDFSLVDADGTPADGEDGVHLCEDLAPGTYYVTENDPTQLSTPFDLSNITCVVNNNPDGTTDYRIGRFVAGSFVNGGTDEYEAGDDTVEITVGTLGEVTCTYTNRQRGSILVRKEDEDGELLPGACFTFDPDPADGTGAAVEVCDGDTADQATGDDGLVCIDNVVFEDYDITESQAPPGYEGDPDTETVTVDAPSTCADRLANEDDPDATFVNLLGTILIHKVSTKSADTFVAGACFTIDDDATNPVAFSGTVCDDDFATATFSDTDAADGVICVEDVPLGDYDITETTVPAGYAGDTDTVSVTVDDSDSCADKALTPDAEFQNVPLADIQIRFRDAGSGETFLDAPLDCDNTTGTESTTDTTDWDDTLTIEDIPINPSPQTIVCTIVIDP